MFYSHHYSYIQRNTILHGPKQKLGYSHSKASVAHALSFQMRCDSFHHKDEAKTLWREKKAFSDCLFSALSHSVIYMKQIE